MTNENFDSDIYDAYQTMKPLIEMANDLTFNQFLAGLVVVLKSGKIEDSRYALLSEILSNIFVQFIKSKED
jgi:hypothetical protein